MGDIKPTGSNSESRSIDWDNISQRLENVTEQIERGWTLVQEKKEEVRKDRDKAHAVEPVDDAGTESVEVVRFLLSGGDYAIESMYVRQVLPLGEITPLPSAPLFILGIINVRGKIVSVVDMRKLLNIPEGGGTEFNKVIILYNDCVEFGILVDSIFGIESVQLKDIEGIQPALSALEGIPAEWFKGVTKERYTLLDAGKILSDERVIVHDEVRT